MKIYLDNCCFNRPFDDQSHLRIRLEVEAKLRIQEEVRAGRFELVWSYLLDYENDRNPFRERREQIAKWRRYATEDIQADPELLDHAEALGILGIRNLDALHLACAWRAGADCFLTTDDGILKKAHHFNGLRILNPIDFILRELP